MAHTPAKFVNIEGHLVNRDEVLWVQPQMKWNEDTKRDEVLGVRIEFIQRGYITINGITPEGVESLLNGALF